jgi:ABC-type methionine transport system permease subunit
VILLLSLLYFLIHLVPSTTEKILQLLPFWPSRVITNALQSMPFILLLLVLLPLAMTMALLWKTKEVILDSVFGSSR